MYWSYSALMISAQWPTKSTIKGVCNTNNYAISAYCQPRLSLWPSENNKQAAYNVMALVQLLILLKKLLQRIFTLQELFTTVVSEKSLVAVATSCSHVYCSCQSCYGQIFIPISL